VPWLIDCFFIVSTGDAFSNGHVSTSSPRVAGYVLEVHVEDLDVV
jgi:multidrug resistance efflux pump